MIKFSLLAFSVLICSFSFAQNEEEAIRNTLMNYINGTSFNRPDLLRQAFYEEADLFLSKEGQDIWMVPAERYIASYEKREYGVANGRTGKILSIDITHDIATAKAEVLIPGIQAVFTDLFLLRKIAGTWKIISKAATSVKTNPPVVHPVKDTILEGLLHPWSMAFMSEEEVLITEKDGHLLKVNLSSQKKEVITGFPNDLVDSIRVIHRGDNSGIFEVLVDPDFPENQFIYISYAAKKGFGTTTKVVRAILDNNQLKSIQTLIEAAPYTREYYHYGGGMTFGADGKLYITIGERLFWERDEPAIPIAQDWSDKRGKIYRINPDGTIPEDNPDFGPDAIPGLFALGIRAAQGITVDPNTGQIWFTEHGTIQGDEINILKAGANYGWPIKTTGKLRSDDYLPPQMEGTTFTDPVWYWTHTVAPTGLTFYTGHEFPQWKGNLLVPGLSRGSLWRLILDGTTIVHTEELFVNDRVRSRKVVQSPQGKLYMLTDEDNGKVIRIRNQ